MRLAARLSNQARRLLTAFFIHVDDEHLRPFFCEALTQTERPMPWAAPVTMAFLFFSLMEFLSFYSMDSVQPGLGLAPGDDAAA